MRHLRLLPALVLVPLLGCATKVGPGDEEAVSGDGDGDPTGDGDGDPTGDGDGDPTGDGDGDGDGDPTADPFPDMAPEYCSLPIDDPLEPTFGDASILGQCPAEVATSVRAVETQGGDWMVNLCDADCGSCDAQLHPLGAPALALADLAPPELDGCYLVEAESLVTQEAGRCVYASLAIFSTNGPIGAPEFVAVRDDWGLTGSAAQALGDWKPILDGGAECPCAEVDPELYECCTNYAQVSVFDLDNGVIVETSGTGSVTIADQTYTFHGQQAQTGTSCELELEVSWALVSSP